MRTFAPTGTCAIMLALVAMSGIGCEPDLSKTSSNPTFMAHHDSTPLPLDPTAPVPVEGWWSNGRQLLQLSEDGAYRLWSSVNRFDAPLQTGRWSRPTYAVVEIEPYGTRLPERTRCQLEPSGSEIRLAIPGLDPMVRFESAPPVIEDRLVGVWRGAGGTLRLTHDGRYRAEAPATASNASSGGSGSHPIALAGHGGRWLVDESNLLLIPDSPSVPTVILAVEALGQENVRLRAGDGAYERVAMQ